MPENSPTAPSPEPREGELADRLDALGRALTARESSEAPAALLSAVRRQRGPAVLARIGLVVGVAAALVICTIVYRAVRPGPVLPSAPVAVEHSGPGTDPARKNALQRQSPTLATLRNLNRDPAPETLRLPTMATSAPGTPIRASDVRDPDSMARLLGSAR